STEKKFHLNVCNANPIILLTLLITLILNVFRHVTHPWCNATLGLLNMLLGAILGTTSEASLTKNPPSDTQHEYIPCDIHTIHKRFNLEPSTWTHATCVKCSCTYAPIAKRNKDMYP
ncbi:hypothetical protein BDN67DRAFT_864383, partial [Paxillus ammoniavirescens]